MADNPLNDMLGKIGGMKAKLDEASQNAARREATVAVGGGMVAATANGRQEITRVTIDPEALKNPDKTMLEDLIVAACNQALSQTKGFVQEEMQKVMGTMGLPQIPGFDLSKLFGGQ